MTSRLPVSPKPDVERSVTVMPTWAWVVLGGVLGVLVYVVLIAN